MAFLERTVLILLRSRDESHPLDNPILWVLDMFPLAARAPPGLGETPSIAKDISTFETLRRRYAKLLFLRGNRALDMGQMITDLFLPNTQGHRKITCAVFIFGKEDYHLLPCSLPGKIVFPFHGTAHYPFGRVHHDAPRLPGTLQLAGAS